MPGIPNPAPYQEPGGDRPPAGGDIDIRQTICSICNPYSHCGIDVATLKQYPAGYRVADMEKPPYRKYEKTGFPTPPGKLEWRSGTLESAGFDPLPTYREPALSPVSTPAVARDFPLVLTAGARLPMFIHGRTFRLPWLKSLRPDPMLDINPGDAEARGIAQGDDVSLATPRNTVVVKANITEIVPPGVINIYQGYCRPTVNTLFPADYLDPISGFPGFKSSLCQVEKCVI